MSRTEYLDRHEPKFHPSYEELKEDSNAHRVHKALQGQLSYSTEEWLRKRGKEQ